RPLAPPTVAPGRCARSPGGRTQPPAPGLRDENVQVTTGAAIYGNWPGCQAAPLARRPTKRDLAGTMKPRVDIYADESCLGVQFTDRAAPGGAAGMIEHWRDDRWIRKDFWVSEPDTTNNRMALRSAIEPLKLLRRPCRVVFTSDSQYLVKGMAEWVPGWIRRGWRRRNGPVENADL